MTHIYSRLVITDAAGAVVYEDDVAIPYSPADGILRYEFPPLPVGEYQVRAICPFIDMPDMVSKLTVTPAPEKAGKG